MRTYFNAQCLQLLIIYGYRKCSLPNDQMKDMRLVLCADRISLVVGEMLAVQPDSQYEVSYLSQDEARR